MKSILLFVSLFAFIFNIHAQAPTITFTVNPTTVCACSSVTFTNTTTNFPTIWAWYFPGGSPSSYIVYSPPGNPPAITYCTPGSYAVTCIVSNGSGRDSVTVQNCVLVKPLPKATIMPPLGGICNPGLDSVYFTVTDTNEGNTYSWVPNANLSCTNCPNPHASPPTNTVYTLIVTGLNGCSTTLTDTIEVGTIEAKITGKDSICQGSSDTLIGSGGSQNPPGTQYRWSNGGTTSSIVVTPSTTTTYSLFINSDGCAASSPLFRVNVVACPLGILEISSHSETFVFPNPNHGSFTLSLSNVNATCNVEIYNILGKKVYTETLPQSQNNNRINLTGQPSGVYFYRVITQNGKLVGSGKVVIQK